VPVTKEQRRGEEKRRERPPEPAPRGEFLLAIGICLDEFDLGQKIVLILVQKHHLAEGLEGREDAEESILKEERLLQDGLKRCETLEQTKQPPSVAQQPVEMVVLAQSSEKEREREREREFKRESSRERESAREREFKRERERERERVKERERDQDPFQRQRCRSWW